MKGYTITRTSENGYEHLTIRLVETDTYENSRPDVALTWQGNHVGDVTDKAWYAFHVRIDTESTQKLTEATRLLKAVGDTVYNTQPDEVVDTLTRKGWKRMVYDSRLSETILAADVQPGLRYLDDFWTAGYENCTVSVLAESEQEARTKLAAEFAARIAARDDVYRTRFAQWVQTGCPVRIDTYGTLPSVKPLSDLLRL